MILKRIIEKPVEYGSDEKYTATEYSVGVRYQDVDCSGFWMKPNEIDARYFRLINSSDLDDPENWEEIVADEEWAERMRKVKASKTESEWGMWSVRDEKGQSALSKAMLLTYGNKEGYHSTRRTDIRKITSVSGGDFNALRTLCKAGNQNRSGFWEMAELIATVENTVGGYGQMNTDFVLKFAGRVRALERMGAAFVTNNSTRQSWDSYAATHLNPNTTSDAQYNKRANAQVINFDLLEVLFQRKESEWKVEADHFSTNQESIANINNVLRFIYTAEHNTEATEKCLARLQSEEPTKEQIKIALIKSLAGNKVCKDIYKERLCNETDNEHHSFYASDIGTIYGWEYKEGVANAPTAQDFRRGVGNAKSNYAPHYFFTEDNEMITQEMLDDAKAFLSDDTVSEDWLQKIGNWKWEWKGDRVAEGRQALIDSLPTLEAAQEAYENAETARTDLLNAIEKAESIFRERVRGIITLIANYDFTLE